MIRLHWKSPDEQQARFWGCVVVWGIWLALTLLAAVSL